MSYARRINHLVRALKQSGFYPENRDLPGCVDTEVVKAIKAFLQYKSEKEDRNVRRVVNAFRNISRSFNGISRATDRVTMQVRFAVKDFLVRNRSLGVYPRRALKVATSG